MLTNIKVCAAQEETQRVLFLQPARAATFFGHSSGTCLGEDHLGYNGQGSRAGRQTPSHSNCRTAVVESLPWQSLCRVQQPGQPSGCCSGWGTAQHGQGAQEQHSDCAHQPALQPRAVPPQQQLPASQRQPVWPRGPQQHHRTAPPPAEAASRKSTKGASLQLSVAAQHCNHLVTDKKHLPGGAGERCVMRHAFRAEAGQHSSRISRSFEQELHVCRLQRCASLAVPRVPISLTAVILNEPDPISLPAS